MGKSTTTTDVHALFHSLRSAYAATANHLKVFSLSVFPDASFNFSEKLVLNYWIYFSDHRSLHCLRDRHRCDSGMTRIDLTFGVMMLVLLSLTDFVLISHGCEILSLSYGCLNLNGLFHECWNFDFVLVKWKWKDDTG